MIKIPNECEVCKNKTIFYIWTTSRNFPRRNLVRYMNIKSKRDMNKIFVEGVPVCFRCYMKIKDYSNIEEKR